MASTDGFERMHGRFVNAMSRHAGSKRSGIAHEI
jgi:hypothetical protein